MTDTTGPTVLLGFLAGVITLAGLVVARGNIISAFRQSWINDQRGDLAIITSKAAIISSNLLADSSKELEAFTAAMSRIRLRENPDNPEWTNVLGDIDVLRTSLWVNHGIRHDVTALIDSIDKRSQRPLKDNWTRTSKGEKRDIRALAAVGVFAAIIALLLVYSFLHPLIQHEQDSTGNSKKISTPISSPPPISVNMVQSNEPLLSLDREVCGRGNISTPVLDTFSDHKVVIRKTRRRVPNSCKATKAGVTSKP